MNRTRRWFLGVVIAQAVFLLTWAGWHEYVRIHSPVVRLKTLPVDPQDLLRGDYMILRYEISAVKRPEPAAPGARNDGNFWVLLEPRDGFYAAIAASHAKPALKPGQIAVVGWAGARDDVAYGIEHFYVSQGKGSPRFKTIEVEASVSPAHRLYIKRVLLDGQSYP